MASSGTGTSVPHSGGIGQGDDRHQRAECALQRLGPCNCRTCSPTASGYVDQPAGSMAHIKAGYVARAGVTRASARALPDCVDHRRGRRRAMRRWFGRDRAPKGTPPRWSNTLNTAVERGPRRSQDKGAAAELAASRCRCSLLSSKKLNDVMMMKPRKQWAKVVKFSAPRRTEPSRSIAVAQALIGRAGRCGPLRRHIPGGPIDPKGSFP